jgi:hypothetical protein
MAHLILFEGGPAHRQTAQTPLTANCNGTEVSEETTLGWQQSEKGGLNQKEVFS